jgi:sugar/nucleoside kinase (ribokinase family)
MPPPVPVRVAPPDLVVLGSLVVDDIVAADGTTRPGEAGGGMFYAALGAALWGVRVGIAGPVGDDYPQAALDALRARHVDGTGLRPLGRPGLRVRLRYETAGRRLLRLPGSPDLLEAAASLADIPEAWRSAPAVHIAPMPLSRQRDLIVALRSVGCTAVLSVDPHTPITTATLDEWSPVLECTDVLFAGEADLRAHAASAEPDRWLAASAGGRLKHVVVKRGEAGGTWLDVRTGRRIAWRPAGGVAVVDPTGAGDALAGGALAGLARGEAPRTALVRGLVSATFAIEGWGAAGLLAATRQEAERRFEILAQTLA